MLTSTALQKPSKHTLSPHVPQGRICQLHKSTNAASAHTTHLRSSSHSVTSCRAMLYSCFPKALSSTQLSNAPHHLNSLKRTRSARATASATEDVPAAATAQMDSRRFIQQQPPLLATAHLLHLGSCCGGSDVGLLPLGPGVYAILDESMCVQYIGISRHISDSITSHIRELPQLACFVKVRKAVQPYNRSLLMLWRLSPS